MERLKQLLNRIDRKGYKAYKAIAGRYQFKDYQLLIDHVQGDPFAEPSRCRILVAQSTLKLPQALYSNRIRCIALEDFIGRRFATAITQHSGGIRDSGKSGLISIAPYGQQVLERNAVLIRDGGLEIRFQVALPAAGRSINSHLAITMLFDELQLIVEHALLAVEAYSDAAGRHVDSVEDQHYLRQQLTTQGLVAFITDGAILPRASGIDDRPLENAVPFKAPDALAVTLDQRHREPARGLGFKQGISLIVGGGFHGKSTLLHAVEYGVYNHIPGDGREGVVTDEGACKIRAEDGRAITGVDISLFINNLPQNKDTKSFSTRNASGSTSQAAAISEALETGSNTLLIDEDTSATNFMIRDARMQALVTKDKEPITPLVQRIRQLHQDYGVSVIMVMGGSGDFFATADTVIMMDNYDARDVTQKAHQLSHQPEQPETNHRPEQPGASRKPTSYCLSPVNANHKEKIRAFAVRTLVYGDEEIDLTRVEQLVDTGQLTAIGYCMAALSKRIENQPEDLVTGLRQLLIEIQSQGLDALTPYIMGTLAMPRLQELVATVNRMHGLELKK